jgi:glutathione S-transferase
MLILLSETIVSNESSEIIRMFYTEFDAFIPEHLRESSKGNKTLLPEHQPKQNDSINDWIYNDINNGVYKTGFATTQEAYEEHVTKLFESLDRVEEHLGQPGHSPYLFGDHITDADIRLYTTLIRFDVAYVGIMKCNLKMIRYDYPRLHDWLRRLYWDESERTNGGAFKKTVDFQAVGVLDDRNCGNSTNTHESTKTDIVGRSRQRSYLLVRSKIFYPCDRDIMRTTGYHRLLEVTESAIGMEAFENSKNIHTTVNKSSVRGSCFLRLVSTPCTSPRLFSVTLNLLIRMVYAPPSSI